MHSSGRQGAVFGVGDRVANLVSGPLRLGVVRSCGSGAVGEDGAGQDRAELVVGSVEGGRRAGVSW
jgi:hypothetical protein